MSVTIQPFVKAPETSKDQNIQSHKGDLREIKGVPRGTSVKLRSSRKFRALFLSKTSRDTKWRSSYLEEIFRWDICPMK